MPQRLPRIVVPWLVLGGVEIAVARGAVARPGLAQAALELGLLLGLGLLQARLAPPGPWRSAAVPGVAAVALAGLAHRPAGLVGSFVFVLGLGLLAGVFVRVLEERLRPGLVVGSLLALLGALLARAVVLEASPVQDARQQLLAELAAAPGSLLPRGGGEGPPILLVSVDTLRWDHALTMESYQQLARSGRAWPRAMASSSWTLPSMASVMTGLPAHLHGARKVPGGGVDAPAADTPRLARDLAAAGYRTGAVVTNPYLSAAVGFDAGFGDWLHINERAPHRLSLLGLPWGPHEWEGEVVRDRALDWLEDAPDRGWFLWVHFLDAHLPYRHVPPGHVATRGSGADLRSGQLFSEADKQALQEGYAHEVSVVDGFVLELLAAAPEANVILVSDHGEEWWDHGGMEHGHSHHGEVVDVAIALAGPDVPPASPRELARGGVAALQDVAATVRALAGLAPDPRAPDSHDLTVGVPADRVALASGNLYERVDWSARQGSRRLIQRGEALEAEAYDLDLDPGEQDPGPPEPELDGPLLQALEAARAGTRAGEAQDQNTAALRALGYLE